MTGGALGSLARYLPSGLAHRMTGSLLPVGTLLVNSAGKRTTAQNIHRWIWPLRRSSLIWGHCQWGTQVEHGRGHSTERSNGIRCKQQDTHDQGTETFGRPPYGYWNHWQKRKNKPSHALPGCTRQRRVDNAWRSQGDQIPSQQTSVSRIGGLKPGCAQQGFLFTLRFLTKPENQWNLYPPCSTSWSS